MLDVCDMFELAVAGLATDSIVDVGTGINGVVGLHLWDRMRGQKIAIDICEVRQLPAGWDVQIMDARGLLAKMGEKSIDIVQCCDFIEHLTKADGHAFLADAERIARKAILLFTPIGFVESPAADRDSHNPYQRHLSGWTYEELEELGYQTGRDTVENMWRHTNIVAWKWI